MGFCIDCIYRVKNGKLIKKLNKIEESSKNK